MTPPPKLMEITGHGLQEIVLKKLLKCFSENKRKHLYPKFNTLRKPPGGNFSKKGGTREWHFDKEILEKNARNKIRVHQCLPIVEKILEKPK